ncbi:Alpha/beta hydrolase fold-1 [Flagelloscypha sp. PMI_526]|nr:Alpha/beta hydrolase fold-1 [Flagelloscypha sp. PMI_526]
MLSETFVAQSTAKYPFTVFGTRYRSSVSPTSGVTLVFAHASATHKEIWEPLLNDLFTIDSKRGSPHILEAWSIDCPNHGESAVANEQCHSRHLRSLGGWEYPRAILHFLNSLPDGVNFYDRNLILVGQSMGGNSVALVQFLDPRLKVQATILCDPAIGLPSKAKFKMQQMLAYFAWTKIDTWPNRKAARKNLGVTPGFKNWDPRVLDVFVAKGLRIHPASSIPFPHTFNGVSLACTRPYEASVHHCNDHHEQAFDTLRQLYRTGKHIHLIMSAEDEFGGATFKEGCGKGPRSAQWSHNGGHMFPQIAPMDTAQKILNTGQPVRVQEGIAPAYTARL